MKLICVCAGSAGTDVTVTSNTHDCPTTATECATIREDASQINVCLQTGSTYKVIIRKKANTDVCEIECDERTEATQKPTDKPQSGDTSGSTNGPGETGSDNKPSAKPGTRVLFICALTFS